MKNRTEADKHAEESQHAAESDSDHNRIVFDKNLILTAHPYLFWAAYRSWNRRYNALRIDSITRQVIFLFSAVGFYCLAGVVVDVLGNIFAALKGFKMGISIASTTVYVLSGAQLLQGSARLARHRYKEAETILKEFEWMAKSKNITLRAPPPSNIPYDINES